MSIWIVIAVCVVIGAACAYRFLVQMGYAEPDWREATGTLVLGILDAFILGSLLERILP